MVAFIDEHSEAYGVEPICAVWPIAPSTYHARKVKSSRKIRGGSHPEAPGARYPPLDAHTCVVSYTERIL
jgi:putative transposase